MLLPDAIIAIEPTAAAIKAAPAIAATPIAATFAAANAQLEAAAPMLVVVSALLLDISKTEAAEDFLEAKASFNLAVANVNSDHICFAIATTDNFFVVVLVASAAVFALVAAVSLTVAAACAVVAVLPELQL